MVPEVAGGRAEDQALLAGRQGGGGQVRHDTALYGMDVELANLMSRYDMKIIGDKEYETLAQDQKQQTLFARMSLISSDKNDNLISIAFDDGVSGKTVASLTSRARGDMFDSSDRTRAFERVSNELLEAIKRDKGLSVTDTKAKKRGSSTVRGAE